MSLKFTFVSEIIISNRTRQRADDLKSQFKILNVIDWGKLPVFDVIINATSLGLNNEVINFDKFSLISDDQSIIDILEKNINISKILYRSFICISDSSRFIHVFEYF